MNLTDEKREALARKLRDASAWWPTPLGGEEARHLADDEHVRTLLAGWLECQYDLGLEDGVAVGEARVRARVEALADEWESRATNARSCVAARLGLSDAEELRAHADLMQRRAEDLRAALAADAAETTGGGE